jgi:hypothetical protein
MNAHAPIESAETALGKLRDEISKFESNKTTQRKAELEAFVQKQKAAVSAYTSEVYEAKRKAWRTVNERVVFAYNALKGLENWKSLVTHCVCPLRTKLKTAEEAYEGLLDNAKGIHERTREKCKADLEAAKATLDALLGNSAKVDAAILRSRNTAEDIITNLKHPESAAAIYSMWFELLPEHRQLAAAADAPTCLSFIGEKETPDELCEKPKAESDETARPATEEPSPLPPLLAIPTIIDPAKYSDQLDLAWAHYARARDASEAAESQLAEFVAGLAKASKDLDTDRKSLATRAKDCLKEHAPEPVCK